MLIGLLILVYDLLKRVKFISRDLNTRTFISSGPYHRDLAYLLLACLHCLL
jgi:hypothetical protein